MDVERKFFDDLELFGQLELGGNGLISARDMLRINQIKLRVLDDLYELKLGQLEERRKKAYQTKHSEKENPSTRKRASKDWK